MPDIHKDGSNTAQHCTDHLSRFWSEVSFIFRHACCLVLLAFSCIYISQDSVATQLWCGGIFNNYFIANCPKSVRVKEFQKLANICQRYGQLQSGTFF